MSSNRIGIYPGTFDPITFGHMDIIQRAMKVLDRLVVGVAINSDKGPMFSIHERVAQVEAEVAELGGDYPGRIDVVGFDNLLVHFAAEQQATVIVRGLRAVSDFDYEFQLSSMNAKLNADVETVCLMASDKYQFIASRLVKEIAVLHGDITPFVSQAVAEALNTRIAERAASD